MIENTEWSVSSLGRATGWAFVALSVGAIAGVSIGGLVAPHAVPLAALLVVAGIAAPFGWAFYRVTIVPAIIATRQDLLIINPYKRYTVSWSEIERIVPGYYGLRISRRGAADVVAWAVQKSNWAQWRGKHVRADEVAHALALQAAAATNSISEAFELSPSEEMVTRRATGRAMAFGATLILVTAVIRIMLGR